MKSVKDKIDAIKKQKETNTAAVKEMNVGVRAIKDKIKKQEQENVAAGKAIDSGAKAIEDKARKLVAEIKSVKDSFKDYTKEFYGYETK